MDLADLRRDYARESLSERDVAPDPIVQFEKWFTQAQGAGMVEPNAMTLATSTRDGHPSARIVLLKSVNAKGFVFYTDYRSRKGSELEANPNVSLCFWWGELQRQVRVTGTVARASRAESEAYYRTRPHGSRIGAWASHQSAPLASREPLEREVQRLEQKYPDDVPLPPHWGGYRVTPETIEFWQGRPSRLHDRIVYTRDGGAWRTSRLSP
ncbi:MAG TPA: pyridoxamine 5'-phosphate oxidase [Gemmatimonadaceae bacterium]